MKTNGVGWLVVAALACAAAGLAPSSCSSGPVVDLGYAKYQDYYNSSYSLNVWKRYADKLDARRTPHSLGFIVFVMQLRQSAS